MEKERLDGLILGNILEFEADNDPMALPGTQTPMEVLVVELLGAPRHAVVEKQAHRPEQIGLARAVLANDRIDPFLEDEGRIVEIAVVYEAEPGNVHPVL